MVSGFLIGVITTACMMAALFFLRFWKETRDPFFLAFSASFFIEGINRIVTASLVDDPSEGHPITYIVRLLSFLLILGAILKKNYETR